MRVKGTIIVLVLVSATLLTVLFLLKSPTGLDVDPNAPGQSISEAPP